MRNEVLADFLDNFEGFMTCFCYLLEIYYMRISG